jgi:predicted PurR-regulated permease PerM
VARTSPWLRPRVERTVTRRNVVFIVLLVVTLLIAAGLAYVVARAFDRPIRRIFDRLVGEELAPAWARYVRFAVLVVGISGGVRIYALERYLDAPPDGGSPRVLDMNRWVLEVYGTIIGTLQSIAWVLLVVFLVALVAYVVMRGGELRSRRRSEGKSV